MKAFHIDNITAKILLVLFVFFALPLITCSKERDDRRYTIGLVTNNPNGMRNIQGFKDEMQALGYHEGDNVSYLYDGNPVKGDELESVLKKMIAEKVDLIFTAGTPTGVAAHRITAGSDIPVIFGVIADPIAAGVLTDLTAPGGNMTGIMLSQNQGKRFEFLLEIAPQTRCVFVPFNPEDPAPVSALEQIRGLAQKLGIDIVEGHARNKSEATALLQTIPGKVDAVFMLPDSTVNPLLSELVAVAIERKLPISGPSMIQVEGGAHTSFGIIHLKVGAQAAHMADQVLKGIAPGSIPVETAEFFLGINLKSMEEAGLVVPADILHQAEIIIRSKE